MKGNQCNICYKFCKYEEMDSYTPYGCASYDPLEPHEPTVICKICSDYLEQEYVEQFKKGNYKGDWCKSVAEQRAAKKCNLIWVGNNSNIEYEGRKMFNEYMPKKGEAK